MHDQRFERLERLVGSSALQRLKGSAVAVFGIGGVGGYAVEALVRGGVGKLTLVDFDILRLRLLLGKKLIVLRQAPSCSKVSLVMFSIALMILARNFTCCKPVINWEHRLSQQWELQISLTPL